MNFKKTIALTTIQTTQTRIKSSEALPSSGLMRIPVGYKIKTSLAESKLGTSIKVITGVNRTSQTYYFNLSIDPSKAKKSFSIDIEFPMKGKEKKSENPLSRPNVHLSPNCEPYISCTANFKRYQTTFERASKDPNFMDKFVDKWYPNKGFDDAQDMPLKLKTEIVCDLINKNKTPNTFLKEIKGTLNNPFKISFGHPDTEIALCPPKDLRSLRIIYNVVKGKRPSLLHPFRKKTQAYLEVTINYEKFNHHTQKVDKIETKQVVAPSTKKTDNPVRRRQAPFVKPSTKHLPTQHKPQSFIFPMHKGPSSTETDTEAPKIVKPKQHPVTTKRQSPIDSPKPVQTPARPLINVSPIAISPDELHFAVKTFIEQTLSEAVSPLAPKLESALLKKQTDITNSPGFKTLPKELKEPFQKAQELIRLLAAPKLTNDDKYDAVSNLHNETDFDCTKQLFSLKFHDLEVVVRDIERLIFQRKNNEIELEEFKIKFDILIASGTEAEQKQVNAETVNPLEKSAHISWSSVLRPLNFRWTFYKAMEKERPALQKQDLAKQDYIREPLETLYSNESDTDSLSLNGDELSMFDTVKPKEEEEEEGIWGFGDC